MSRDPQRYQPLLPALFLEKPLYPVGTYVYVHGRVDSLTTLAASGDLVWLALFVAVSVKLRQLPIGEFADRTSSATP